jgi:hypothetical protein
VAFREQRFQALCSVCKNEAEDHCLRCNKPLCAEHRPEGDQRCDECEVYFADSCEAILAGQATSETNLTYGLDKSSSYLAAATCAAFAIWASRSLAGDELYWALFWIFCASLAIGSTTFAVSKSLSSRSIKRATRGQLKKTRKLFLDERPGVRLLGPPTAGHPPM